MNEVNLGTVLLLSENGQIVHLATFLIKKFNFSTPERAGNYIEEEASTAMQEGKAADGSLASTILALLGGEDNIEDVDACMTHLRVTIKHIDKVAAEQHCKQNGELGLILKDKGVQAIYGPKADVLKSDIQDRLGA